MSYCTEQLLTIEAVNRIFRVRVRKELLKENSKCFSCKNPAASVTLEICEVYDGEKLMHSARFGSEFTRDGFAEVLPSVKEALVNHDFAKPVCASFVCDRKFRDLVWLPQELAVA